MASRFSKSRRRKFNALCGKWIAINGKPRWRPDMSILDMCQWAEARLAPRYSLKQCVVDISWSGGTLTMVAL